MAPVARLRIVMVPRNMPIRAAILCKTGPVTSLRATVRVSSSLTSRRRSRSCLPRGREFSTSLFILDRAVASADTFILAAPASSRAPQMRSSNEFYPKKVPAEPGVPWVAYGRLPGGHAVVQTGFPGAHLLAEPPSHAIAQSPSLLQFGRRAGDAHHGCRHVVEGANGVGCVDQRVTAGRGI